LSLLEDGEILEKNLINLNLNELNDLLNYFNEEGIVF
jgi:hypothetical protein